jgi:hypothetical protein
MGIKWIDRSRLDHHGGARRRLVRQSEPIHHVVRVRSAMSCRLLLLRRRVQIDSPSSETNASSVDVVVAVLVQFFRRLQTPHGQD